MTTIGYIPGFVVIGDRSLTLRQAITLREDLLADFEVAFHARRHAAMKGLVLDTMRTGDLIVHLSGVEGALRVAIDHATAFRLCAGHADPHAADGPEDLTGTEWDCRRVGAS